MKKHLLIPFLTFLLLAGIVPVLASNTTSESSSLCSGSSDCPLDKGPCPYKILTKSECQRFCKARAAAVAVDPTLADPKNTCKLCAAIMKEDHSPSMRRICMKIRKSEYHDANCMDHSSFPEDASNSTEQTTSTSGSSTSTSSEASTTSPTSATQESTQTK